MTRLPNVVTNHTNNTLRLYICACKCMYTAPRRMIGMKGILILGVFCCLPCYAGGAAYEQLQGCLDPDQQGFLVSMNQSEFLETYTRVFRMSDGSTFVPDSEDAPLFMESLKYTKGLLGAIGVDLLDSEDSIVRMRVCGPDIARIFLLGVVGNFVTSPSDPKISSSQSSSEPIASIVMDVYTGRLALVHPFSAIRTYFLETMLIVSILAIAKLSLVQGVSVPAPAEKGA